MRINRYGRALARARRSPEFLDLINTNFHAAELAPAGTLLASLCEEHLTGPGRHYAPDPAGLAALRAQISARYSSTAPEQIVVTASASESYEHIFRGLCRRGATILLPQPGYPLFEEVARRCGLEPAFYALRNDHGWQPDVEGIVRTFERANPGDIGALVFISPNNPTGGVLTAEIARTLGERCARAATVMILDEVFSDFVWMGDRGRIPLGTLAPGATCCTINGMSKLFASPDLKVSWIAVTGPDTRVAVESLQVESDLFLNASPLSQAIAAELLRDHHEITRRIVATVGDRRETLIEALRALRPAAKARIRWSGPDGGIHLPLLLDLPPGMTDEDVAVRLLDEAALGTHPGYLYGFHDHAIVLSCLPPESVLIEGMERLGEFLEALGSTARRAGRPGIDTSSRAKGR